MTRIVPLLATVEEKRAALVTLTRYYAVATALTDRLAALLDTVDHPSVDRPTWDALIAEAIEQRRELVERIDELRLQLGIGDIPDQVH